MANLSQLPPWLDASPGFFTSALESGARTGLAVADMNQRAQEAAEARAQRQSQEQERQREFEASHLLNVQKLAEDTARLQQQVAHQTAQEKAQAAQESRLLGYDVGRLGVQQQEAKTAQQRADLASKIAGEHPTWHAPAEGVPGYFELPRGGVNVPSASVLGDSDAIKARARVGTEMTTPSGIHAVWVGPNQIRVTPPDGSTKDLTPGQLLSYADKFQYSMNPTNRATSEAIQGFLGQKATKQLTLPPATNAPTVLAPPAAASPYAIRTPPTVATKSEYDALPEGTVFIGSDGKPYRKPAKK